ncbi:hypothetical protein F4678DRAFT_455405 [Xylaria arbuscula]|nr:hypothetical protein F4678DRAFT_455405 [Xylaria arbuscula]
MYNYPKPQTNQLVDQDGNPVDTSKMSKQGRFDAMRRGELKLRNGNTGLFKIIEPDAVTLPHINGRPVGMIINHEPMNSTNIMSYMLHDGIHAQFNWSVGAMRELEDMAHAIFQPGPNERIGITACVHVPNSVSQMKMRMAADLRSTNTINRPLNHTERPARPSHEEPGSYQGGVSNRSCSRGVGSRGGINRRPQPKLPQRRINHPQDQGKKHKYSETELEKLDRELDEYFAADPPVPVNTQ